MDPMPGIPKITRAGNRCYTLHALFTIQIIPFWAHKLRTLVPFHSPTLIAIESHTIPKIIRLVSLLTLDLLTTAGFITVVMTRLTGLLFAFLARFVQAISKFTFHFLTITPPFSQLAPFARIFFAFSSFFIECLTGPTLPLFFNTAFCHWIKHVPSFAVFNAFSADLTVAFWTGNFLAVFSTNKFPAWVTINFLTVPIFSHFVVSRAGLVNASPIAEFEPRWAFIFLAAFFFV
jgi:hypothetical protein